MKKVSKVFGFLLGAIILVLVILYFAKNEKLPEGVTGPEADEIAQRIMASLNKTAWDSTRIVSWTFGEVHHYEWDIKNDRVKVEWEHHTVMLFPGLVSGKVLNDAQYTEEEKSLLLNSAFNFFNNDSFWLAAPLKLFDPGVERSLVELRDGRKGLKVTYTQGGSTPGDSYVWLVDHNNRPTSVKMWVSIFPVGGIEFTWENYVILPSGAMLAQDHWLPGVYNVKLTNIK